MQITVTFDSLEEFLKYVNPSEGFEPEPKAVPAEKKKRGQPKKTEPVPEGFEPAPAEEVPFEEPAPQPPAVTLTDVRAVALKFSKAGKRAALKDAFGKFGAKRLSGISEENYPALMEELMKIDA